MLQLSLHVKKRGSEGQGLTADLLALEDSKQAMLLSTVYLDPSKRKWWIGLPSAFQMQSSSART